MEPDRFALRTAFEALRAGAPNRSAVRLLGSGEDAVEDSFEAGLEAVWSQRSKPGLMIAGGFGTGKSHLLSYLREVASQQNFVVSMISISKETPLFAPLEIFKAAMRNGVAPGHADDVVTAALAQLQQRSSALLELEARVSAPANGFSPVFAAMLHLLKRPVAPELLRRMETFLAGGKPPGPMLRQALVDAGARGVFDLTRSGDPLGRERERFAPLLFSAAGFAGWCLLIDEVELIGRYSPLQRARAYAELGRRLGLGQGTGTPGALVTGAITDDFASAVINGRLDDEKLPERLRLKGAPEEADLALAAMRAIEKAPLLHAPTDQGLAKTAETLRRCYTLAYGWEAPPPPPAERRANRTMRHHVRGWITQWDILRLEGRSVGLEMRSLTATYAVSQDLSNPATASDDEA